MATNDLSSELRCSVCLDIYKDPVTLPCGHSFCRECISQTWDHQESIKERNCPECQQRYKTRPELKPNPRLRNIAESFLRSQPDHELTGIFCTYCDSSVPAVRSCLQCETSMCDNHLKKHNNSVDHRLLRPTRSVREKKCSIHKKMLEYYCTEESACICVSCRLEGLHMAHKVETLEEASEKKKTELRNVQKKLDSKKEEMEKRVQRLQKRRGEVQGKVASDKEKIVALLRDIRRQLEEVEKSVLAETSRQEERMLHPVNNLIQQLDVKKAELSKTVHHIEDLCNATDPLNVIQEQKSYKDNLFDTEEDEEAKNQEDKFMHDTADFSVSLILGRLRYLSDVINDVHREISKEEADDLSLDISSAGNYLHISDDLYTASWSEKSQNRPETAARFKTNQVISIRKYSTGQHYWQVKSSDPSFWRIGVCYPSMDRKGNQSLLGYNRKSWCLCKEKNRYSVIHDFKVTKLSHPASCNGIGIFLNYDGGKLIFYELCDPIRCLHTFTACFTEPLHLAFWLCGNKPDKDSWLKMVGYEKK